MASAINPLLPADFVPAVKEDLRNNLAAAKAEIEALQAAGGLLTGAAGNGTTDDRAAFAAISAGTGVIVGAGTYRIASNLTIAGHLWFLPGAMLRPDAGVTVSWAAGASITAGDYQIFSPATGGLFNGVNVASWARSSWFPGTTSGARDLGLQLHNAMQWGFLQIDVPPAADHVIRTTVRLLHGATIRCMWHGYPRHVVCATNDKPVFEAVGPVRHWRIIGGVFDGAAVNTPSCFLLCGRDNATAGQCGDTTALSETHVTGNWGVGVVVSISAEVLVFSNCNLWIQGKGDATWAGNNSTITIGNADYWNVPFTYTQPNQVAGSCSAVVFQNCDIRGGVADAGTVFFLKGQVEDLSITATYLNAVGRCHILCEPGQVGAGSWTSPRRLYLGGGGRTENNKGIAWNGVPTIIIDGINVAGAGLYILHFGAMGHFIGGQANSTPIIKTERGGQLYAFTMEEASWIDATDVLLESTVADLNWARIWHPWAVTINCTGRTLNNCDIKIGGDVLGTIGATTTVRASNVNNWPVP